MFSPSNIRLKITIVNFVQNFTESKYTLSVCCLHSLRLPPLLPVPRRLELFVPFPWGFRAAFRRFLLCAIAVGFFPCDFPLYLCWILYLAYSCLASFPATAYQTKTYLDVHDLVGPIWSAVIIYVIQSLSIKQTSHLILIRKCMCKQ